MIKTRINEILDIEYPIFQGGMAWVGDAVLAAAVSQAGGLGLIAGMNSNRSQIAEEIEKARGLTGKVFGVNLMLMSPFTEEVVDEIIRHKVPVVTTGAGNPGKYMPRLIEAGIKVIPVVPTVAFARRMENAGAVAVVAEGTEAGGHIGELTTMVLIPQISQAVDIPVVAAGGIADGRGYAAALMLGAEGVQMGTRFIVADECRAHDNFKDKVLKAGDRDTVTTGHRLGHPVRALKNPFTRTFAEYEKDASYTDEELHNLGAGALRMAVLDGDLEKGSFMAGQGSALVKKRQSAAEIINEVSREAESILKDAGKWLS